MILQLPQRVDFLDITFNINENSYRPYRKPNDSMLYIDTMSDHPPCIKRGLPNMIEHRISRLCSNENIFEEEKTPYEEALISAGYKNVNLTYRPERKLNPTKDRKQNCKRSICWFNPPFSSIVKTKVGKEFFRILDKNFPKDSPLAKIMNRNFVKLSYSCMPNMHCIISGMNKRKINDYTVKNRLNKEDITRECNCNNKSECPFGGKCLTESVVYLATVSTTGLDKHYYGLTEGPFKQRWNKHNSDFRLPHHRYNTDLSEYIWSCKDKSVDYSIKWSLVEKVPKFRPNRKNFCQLCVTEKKYILEGKPETLINKRDEFLNKCRHANKFKLRNFKYEGNVDLLYHTANPLIQNEPAVNIKVKNLSKPKRNEGTSNLNQEVTTRHKSDTISRHTVCVHTDNILTSARARTQNKSIYNQDFVT